MSHADQEFILSCREIIDHGFSDQDFHVRPKWEDGTPAHTIRKFGIVNRYDLSKEFPIHTIRKINFEALVDEILWIWQKKSNDIHQLNSHIWDEWADKNGSIGKAYGYQLGVKYNFPEGYMDQVDMVLCNLKDNPMSRRMVTHIFNYADLNEMRLQPCVWSVTFNVNDGRLNATVNQRSQDMLTANSWNVAQYAVLVHMFAQVSGLQVGELLHVITDAHIYDRHIPLVEKCIANEPYPAPKLIINPDIKDFYEFRVEDFRLEDYNYHKLGAKIPVAV